MASTGYCTANDTTCTSATGHRHGGPSFQRDPSIFVECPKLSRADSIQSRVKRHSRVLRIFFDFNHHSSQHKIFHKIVSTPHSHPSYYETEFLVVTGVSHNAAVSDL